jgi:hypothetical protein
MTETLANIHINRQQQKRERSPNSLPKNNSTLAMCQMRVQENVKRSGSFVVGQKLRESKWFTHAEMNIFCAVVESGFIIEQKQGEVSRYGVVIWAPGYGEYCARKIALASPPTCRKEQEPGVCHHLHRHREQGQVQGATVQAGRVLARRHLRQDQQQMRQDGDAPRRGRRQEPDRGGGGLQEEVAQHRTLRLLLSVRTCRHQRPDEEG